MKQKATIVINIPFCDGMNVERTLKELKSLERRIEIPKKGFINRKKKIKEIQRKKKFKKIYGEIIDLIELTKKLKGKIIQKEFHYIGKKADENEENYAVYILEFPCDDKKRKFEEVFFDLYPNLKMVQD